MERRHNLYSSVILKFSTQFGNAFFSVKKVLHRDVTQDYDNHGPHNVDFSQDERFAGNGFDRCRSPVLRRAAAIYVPNEYVLAFKADDLCLGLTLDICF